MCGSVIVASLYYMDASQFLLIPVVKVYNVFDMSSLDMHPNKENLKQNFMICGLSISLFLALNPMRYPRSMSFWTRKTLPKPTFLAEIRNLS